MRAAAAVLLWMVVASCGESYPSVAPSPEVQAELRQILDSPTSEELEALTLSHQLESESIITDCMIRDGFEYVAAGRRAVEPSPEARRVADLTDEEFASLYGFGFSTLIDLDPLGLIREDIAPDPNATIREAMSEPELSAYADRLTRCRQQAYEQLPAPPGGFALSAETDAVLEEIETMVTSDRRFVAAVDTYRRCMADEGLQFDSASTCSRHLRNGRNRTSTPSWAHGTPSLDGRTTTLSTDSGSPMCLASQSLQTSHRCRPSR